MPTLQHPSAALHHLLLARLLQLANEPCHLRLLQPRVPVRLPPHPALPIPPPTARLPDGAGGEVLVVPRLQPAGDDWRHLTPRQEPQDHLHVGQKPQGQVRANVPQQHTEVHAHQERPRARLWRLLPAELAVSRDGHSADGVAADFASSSEKLRGGVAKRLRQHVGRADKM